MHQNLLFCILRIALVCFITTHLGNDVYSLCRFYPILAPLQTYLLGYLRYNSKDSLLSADSLKSFATHLNEKCSNVLVMAGAGLSTPSGIPDFR